MTVSMIEHETCRTCGRPVTGWQPVLSRHSTSEGVVIWVRCSCGALQARLRAYGDTTDRVVAASGSSLPDRPNRSDLSA